MKILKQEKGSITLFVLIAMLFFSMYLVGMYMLSANSEATQITETSKIKEIYEQDVNQIDEIYAKVTNKKSVNEPNFKGTGLTPVTIQEDGTTTKANVTTSDWYSYDGTTNQWANATSKDGSMWVWIPRFAYKITYTNEMDKSKGGTIDVVFLKDTSKFDFNGNDVTETTYIDEKGVQGAYIVHPAFQDGSNTGYLNGEWDKEISGFWIAKFEAGYVGEAQQPNTAVDSNVGYSTIYGFLQNGGGFGDITSNYYGTRTIGTKIKYPTFQPNRPSMNYIGISDAYDLCMDLKNAKDIYGLSNVDTHLPKNSEWGAIAYLTHSKYGRNGTEVTINNVSLNNVQNVYAVTGYGGATVSADEVVTTWEAIRGGTQPGSWVTTQGQAASSTGNIYGIYDLSGGTWEWTSGYIALDTDNYQNYAGNLKGDSSRYKTKYEGTSEVDTENYNEVANAKRKGEAIWETSSNGTGANAWNDDWSYFLYGEQPFSIRGRHWGGKTTSGTFTFYRWHGHCNFGIGFRAILISE